MSTGVLADPALSRMMRGEEMLQAEEVAAMLRLHELGWGAKRLAREFGCARRTVRRYLRQGGPVPFRKPERRTAFDGLDDWLRERFFRHGRQCGRGAPGAGERAWDRHWSALGGAAGTAVAPGIEGADARERAV